MDSKVLICFALVSLFSCSFALPIWKVFCTSTPLFRGRADPIVDPGILSQHSHKVWGGNNFGLGRTPVNAIDYFDHVRASKCTTCSITLDLSNYWISDLYYRWPNGSLSLVPNGGLTVYYLSRGGSGAQSKPDIKPFPPGLRVVSGNPWRRSYNDSSIPDQAISYACIGGGGPETPGFPTATRKCTGGLRAQVWFPMCWDGVNLDSPDHKSHMSHPITRPDGGNCPATHPVRLPGVFFEVLFDVNQARFPHGDGVNPFVWANGDSTGYGLHGDFLNAWDTDLVAAALKDPMCDLDVNKDLDFGNNVRACPPMRPYVKDSNPNGACQMATPVPVIEDLGLGHLINKLPGCNPITGEQPNNVVPCRTAQTPPTLEGATRRVVLRSASNNKYLKIDDSDAALAANSDGDVSKFTQVQVFLFKENSVDNLGGFNIMSEQTEDFLSAPNSGNNPMQANRGNPSGWEVFFAEFNNAAGTVRIQANSNKKWLSVNADGTVTNSATTANTNSSLFYFTDAAALPASAPPQQTIPPNPVPVDVYSTNSGSATTGSATSKGASSSSGSGATNGYSYSGLSTASSGASTGTAAASGAGPTSGNAPGSDLSPSSASTSAVVSTLFLGLALLAL